MRRNPALPLAVLALFAGLATACGEAPREAYLQARQAADAKDFEAFAGWFTDRSASLLRGLHSAADETRGRYEYVKDLYDVLPSGDVFEEKIDGSLAILKVGASERAAEEVILLREVDGWRIDILDSPRLWEPLTTGGPR